MFEELWQKLHERSRKWAMPIVQEKNELEHIFYLIQGCESYLEVGTAEGNSLLVLSHALKPDAKITYIDLGEKHTTEPRNEVLQSITQKVTPIHGDSNDFKTYVQVQNEKFDVVFIDAGHDDFNVAIDALFYGPLATKYIIFHDVTLPDVARVFDWYCRQLDKQSYKVINSENYGYGVIKV